MSYYRIHTDVKKTMKPTDIWNFVEMESRRDIEFEKYVECAFSIMPSVRNCGDAMCAALDLSPYIDTLVHDRASLLPIAQHVTSRNKLIDRVFYY